MDVSKVGVVCRFIRYGVFRELKGWWERRVKCGFVIGGDVWDIYFRVWLGLGFWVLKLGWYLFFFVLGLLFFS